MESEKYVTTRAGEITGIHINDKTLYCGNGNIPIVKSFCRSLTFFILHNHLAKTYTSIAKRTGMRPTSIMRSLARLPQLLKDNTAFQKTYDSIIHDIENNNANLT